MPGEIVFGGGDRLERADRVDGVDLVGLGAHAVAAGAYYLGSGFYSSPSPERY